MTPAPGTSVWFSFSCSLFELRLRLEFHGDLPRLVGEIMPASALQADERRQASSSSKLRYSGQLKETALTCAGAEGKLCCMEVTCHAASRGA